MLSLAWFGLGFVAGMIALVVAVMYVIGKTYHEEEDGNGDGPWEGPSPRQHTRMMSRKGA